MELKDFVGNTGFNKDKSENYQIKNQEKVNKYKQEFIDSQKYNTGRVIVDSDFYSPVERIKFFDLIFPRHKR